MLRMLVILDRDRAFEKVEKYELFKKTLFSWFPEISSSGTKVVPNHQKMEIQKEMQNPETIEASGFSLELVM